MQTPRSNPALLNSTPQFSGRHPGQRLHPSPVPNHRLSVPASSAPAPSSVPKPSAPLPPWRSQLPQPPTLPIIRMDHVRPIPPASPTPNPQRLLLGGGWLVALFVVAMNLGANQGAKVRARARSQALCQTVVQPNATLSREQLARVLTVPERASQSQIREQLAQPYCQLPDLELRVGVTAQREAYPLAFDPQTWLVLLFEADEYAGYAFQFHP